MEKLLSLYERVRFIVYGLILGLSIAIVLSYLRAKPEEQAVSSFALIVAAVAIAIVFAFSMRLRSVSGRK
jgi:NhaP-type Na+/H+ or K+/H+ antiporter